MARGWDGIIVGQIRRLWDGGTLPAAETQATLRRRFARRGPPRRIRVDDGTPWRSKGDLPTGPELWPAGPGVEVRANPPRRPQDDGVAGRSQGTGKRGAEPRRAASAEEPRATIDAMDRRRRESYPHTTAAPVARPPTRAWSIRADPATNPGRSNAGPWAGPGTRWPAMSRPGGWTGAGGPRPTAGIATSARRARSGWRT